MCLRLSCLFHPFKSGRKKGSTPLPVAAQRCDLACSTPSDLEGIILCLQLLSAARLGEQVYKGHHSYDLMRNLQLGILFSIAKSGRLSPLGAKRSLDPSDFSMQVGPDGHRWLVEHVRAGLGSCQKFMKTSCNARFEHSVAPSNSSMQVGTGYYKRILEHISQGCSLVVVPVFHGRGATTTMPGWAWTLATSACMQMGLIVS